VDSFNRSYRIVDLAPVHMWNMDNINNFPLQYNDTDIILIYTRLFAILR